MPVGGRCRTGSGRPAGKKAEEKATPVKQDLQRAKAIQTVIEIKDPAQGVDLAGLLQHLADLKEQRDRALTRLAESKQAGEQSCIV